MLQAISEPRCGVAKKIVLSAVPLIRGNARWERIFEVLVIYGLIPLQATLTLELVLPKGQCRDIYNSANGRAWTGPVTGFGKYASKNHIVRRGGAGTASAYALLLLLTRGALTVPYH